MLNVLKKISKWIILISCLLVFIGIGFLFYFYLSSDRIKLDQSKFYENISKIEFFDSENKPISENNSFNIKFVELKTLPSYVSESFISIEDKDFFKHNGLNYKRIIKALLLDLKNRNMAQGASTITQQLIKNTHLSSQKTFSRKLNEIVLAKELERKLSKEQILENYLNIIYFGDNCYGIERASNHYFSKPAKHLTLNESALLAGLISSPARYSPTTKPQKANERKNLVLSEMLRDGKISQEDFEKNNSLEIELNLEKQKDNRLNSYTEACLDEAIAILKMPAKQISNGNFKIYTNYNSEKQNALIEVLKNTDFEENDFATICINSKTGEIEAFYGKGDYKILEVKRQPGSAIKPVLVYAPAINEGIISPLTQILDEQISIAGYTPSNHDSQFHGYLSVRDAVCKSYNIPAVKVMSYTGIKKSKYYAEECGIEFSENDDNYALALGGMTHGTDLKQLCGAYTTLSNDGNFIKPSFIKYITDSNGKIIYVSKLMEKQVFRDDTSYLMTNILIEASKNGTSKRLSSLDFEVASKTGTVGKGSKNLDAWAVSYTTQDIFGVWIGNLNNETIGKIVGGTVPIDVTKEFMLKIYAHEKPEYFKKPSSVEEVEIDLKELEENHQVIIANNFLPEKYRKKEIFSRFNLPKNQPKSELSIKPAQLEGKIVDNIAIISFEAVDYLEYELLEDDMIIMKFENKNGKVEQKIKMDDKKQKKFLLITKMKNYSTGEEIEEKSNTIELIKTKVTNQKEIKKDKRGDRIDKIRILV